MTDNSVVLYLRCEGKDETVEFSSDDTIEDVRCLFRTAAEAHPEDILKLYDVKGSLIRIHAKLRPNDPTTRYVLKVLRRHISTKHLMCLAPAAEADVDKIVERINAFEETLTKCEMPDTLLDLQMKSKRVLETIWGLSYLQWLRVTEDGIPKGRQRVMSYPFWWQPSSERTEIHRSQIRELFLALIKVDISEEVRQGLRSSNFDLWHWSDAHMLAQMRQMYIDLDIVSHLNMDEEILHNWLLKVYTCYQMVPFHNFRHCFSVTQMMYSLIWTLNLNQVLDHVDLFTLLTAAASHDLDHPGFNNAFQANTESDIYRRHQTSSLEHHHIDTAFSILDDESCSIDRFLPEERRQPFRDLMTRIILATDLAKSADLLHLLHAITQFDMANQEHKHVLMTAFVKVSDVSNETRRLEISARWLDCLLQEFFNQNELEKLENLPHADFMDKDIVTKPSAQIGFITNVLLPLLDAIHRFYPNIQELIDTAKENRAYYIKLQAETEAEELECKKAEPVAELAELVEAVLVDAEPVDAIVEPAGAVADVLNGGPKE